MVIIIIDSIRLHRHILEFIEVIQIRMEDLNSGLGCLYKYLIISAGSSYDLACCLSDSLNLFPIVETFSTHDKSNQRSFS